MEYRQCTRCVMDNVSDNNIRFDSDGYCHYCSKALDRMSRIYFPNEEGKKRLDSLITQLKEKGKGMPYDCIMGLSGGLDSAYLAYLGAMKWGLRILAVHVDDGFDTKVAKENNRKLAEACNLQLINEKPNSEQYRDLVRAFIRAGVPNIAIPQDNLIFGYMHQYAKKYNVKSFLSGANFALESILQGTNTHSAFDKRHILDINRRFGEKGLDKLHITSLFEKTIADRVHGIRTLKPLNYIDYNRERAIKELGEFCGYSYYGGKHYESVFTKFMQTYYLPNKFGVDKRSSHLSSMIVSGQLSREDALKELEKPLCNKEAMEQDISIILDMIGLPRAEFDNLMLSSPKKHSDYKISSTLITRSLKVLDRIL